ncbi:MAG: hypothetical protein QMC89_02605 [Candidatus Hodarchaeaceae archaeon]|nr:hypothetical protein [Candidatus Hodarchaeaceae archaeon]
MAKKKKTLLITRPDHDITTSYYFHWSQKVVVAARRRGIRVIDLYGKRANKKEVEEIIKAQNPNLTLFNGHGTEAKICGHKDGPLIIAGVNGEWIAYYRSHNLIESPQIYHF